MTDLQTAWRKSLAAIDHPVAARASALQLTAMRRDDTGKGQVFDLIGQLGSHDAKRLAVLLHHGLRVPVSVVVRNGAGANAVRAYCDAGTQFNLEVILG